MSQSDKQYLDHLRHSCAHLLAAAVLELRPDAKPTIGPSIENGFYYDFDFGDQPLSENDLPKIEKIMRQLVKNWDGFERIELDATEARERVERNEYKQELIDEFLAEDKAISFYKSGSFEDLCRGGHVDNPKDELKHFKLLSLAGAYWRGNEDNKMLTRIYGTAFASKEELDEHINMLEEAKKRDHKKLGILHDLFSFSDKVGSGLALWTPKGTLMRNILDDFVWDLRKAKGYQQVEIPHITKKDLFETSGHWEKFEDELFKINTREGHIFAMKPMNCPFHTQIFDRKPHSYREMPQRYANTTMVYRDEQSGELSGLSRVRCITQDDAHVFCRISQIKDEMKAIWDIIDSFYKAVGFDLYVRLSLSDPSQPEKYLGDKETWMEAEQMLREIGKERGVDLIEAVGEAAFYGPKLDFMAKDSLGREWQVATNQLDMNMPVRFGLTCTNEKAESEQVYMLHAAIMGSIERYMSILIEHFAGAFPLWLAPVQAVIIPIGSDHQEYSDQVLTKLKENDIRAEIWSEGSMGKRIRLAEKQKVPYMMIVGDKEQQSGQVSLRLRGQQNRGAVAVEELIRSMTKLVNSRSLDLE